MLGVLLLSSSSLLSMFAPKSLSSVSASPSTAAANGLPSAQISVLGTPTGAGIFLVHRDGRAPDLETGALKKALSEALTPIAHPPIAVPFAVLSQARLLITLICFYHSFPPRFRQAQPAPKPKGATQAAQEETLRYIHMRIALWSCELLRFPSPFQFASIGGLERYPRPDGVEVLVSPRSSSDREFGVWLARHAYTLHWAGPCVCWIGRDT